jgi:hypothetical protein
MTSVAASRIGLTSDPLAAMTSSGQLATDAVPCPVGSFILNDESRPGGEDCPLVDDP